MRVCNVIDRFFTQTFIEKSLDNAESKLYIIGGQKIEVLLHLSSISLGRMHLVWSFVFCTVQQNSVISGIYGDLLVPQHSMMNP